MPGVAFRCNLREVITISPVGITSRSRKLVRLWL